MNKKPIVSIIMNCHNGQTYLGQALKSIIGQNYKNWELIFWDNKSSDRSAEIFKSIKDKRLKYFYSEKKTVLYKARNLAIKKARGQFLAFLDVDDFWRKDKLSKQLIKFKNKKIGLVYSNLFKYYGKNNKKIAHNHKLPEGKVTKKIIKDYSVGMLTIIVRKSFVSKMKNIFNYKYDLIADFDFVLNFSLKYDFACINEPLAYYRIHNEQLQKKQMIIQAKQYCKWYKEKKVSKVFKDYDLSKIKYKFRYYDLLREIENNKINFFIKIFKNFNFVIFIKIIAIILLPKKILMNMIENV